MASLNTLRTRFGVVLSIIIAFALLAFILSLKTDMGLSGNDPKVGVIDGSKIRYSEYIEVYNNLKDQSNISESNEEQMDQLAEMAWQTLIANHVYLPGFEKMGISVTDAEREGLISGEYYSGTMAAAFTDPRTGQYSVEGVSDFIAQATGNPQMQYMWGALVGQAMREREINKYNGLVKGGVYVNRLEAEEGVDAQNKTFSGSWVGKRYHDMPDSLFSVSDSEIKAYYNSHKARYEQKPSRTLSYVVFEVAPSAEDMATLEKTVREVGDEFAASDDPKAFAKNNRFGKITDNYRSVAQLLDDEAEALANGKQYGPVLKNDTWTMTRVVETLNAPDSVGVRHIVLTYDQRDLADSLMTALRQGADFAQAARTHSLYMQDAGNGGDAGVMPFSAFPDELSGLLSTAKQGDILRVEVGDVIQILQVYRLDKPSKHMRLATITYPVEASSATRRNVHSQASLFSVEGKGSVDAFNEAANKGNLTPREAKLTQGDRRLQGLADSRELVRWAYDAKVGAISEIFPVGDDYVVAVVTEIDNEDYTPIEKVANNIRQTLITDKKFEKIVSEMKGSTIEEVAQNLGTEVVPFEDVRYGSFFIRNMGVEPRVIGAITATEQTNTLSEPVKGNVGAYVFVVTDIQEAETPQSIEAEKVRAEGSSQGMIQRRLFDFLEQMSNVEDLRGKYF